MLNPLPALHIALLPTLEESSRLGGTEGPDLTRYFVVCGILLVATILVAWGFRRLVAGNLRSRAAKRSLQVVDVLPLGGKRRLAVVRCYDRTFVLGLGDREISPIAELDPVTESRASTAPAASDRADFEQALEVIHQAMPRRKIAKKKAPLPSESPRVVKRKVRKRKVKAETRGKSAETVAQAARRIASARREASTTKPEPTPAKNEAPPIRRLEGLLG